MKKLNPGGGIYKAENEVTSLLSALMPLTGFTPFSIEITQPGLPGSGVHK